MVLTCLSLLAPFCKTVVTFINIHNDRVIYAGNKTKHDATTIVTEIVVVLGPELFPVRYSNMGVAQGRPAEVVGLPHPRGKLSLLVTSSPVKM